MPVEHLHKHGRRAGSCRRSTAADGSASDVSCSARGAGPRGGAARPTPGMLRSAGRAAPAARAARPRGGQKQNLFLNGGRQKQQVHDLWHARTRYESKPCQLREIGKNTLRPQVLQLDGQRHATSKHSGIGIRRCHSSRKMLAGHRPQQTQQAGFSTAAVLKFAARRGGLSGSVGAR